MPSLEVCTSAVGSLILSYPDENNEHVRQAGIYFDLPLDRNFQIPRRLDVQSSIVTLRDHIFFSSRLDCGESNQQGHFEKSCTVRLKTSHRNRFSLQLTTWPPRASPNLFFSPPFDYPTSERQLASPDLGKIASRG